MASKTSKAPLGGACGALDNAYHGQAISIRDLPLSTSEVQTNFVARRTRLQPDLARVVAELIYGRAA